MPTPPLAAPCELLCVFQMEIVDQRRRWGSPAMGTVRPLLACSGQGLGCGCQCGTDSLCGLGQALSPSVCPHVRWQCWLVGASVLSVAPCGVGVRAGALPGSPRGVATKWRERTGDCWRALGMSVLGGRAGWSAGLRRAGSPRQNPWGYSSCPGSPSPARWALTCAGLTPVLRCPGAASSGHGFGCRLSPLGLSLSKVIVGQAPSFGELSVILLSVHLPTNRRITPASLPEGGSQASWRVCLRPLSEGWKTSFTESVW